MSGLPPLATTERTSLEVGRSIQVMQQEAGLEAGDVTISARSWETFSFGVYHLQELVNGLHTQYHRDGEADASTSS